LALGSWEVMSLWDDWMNSLYRHLYTWKAHDHCFFLLNKSCCVFSKTPPRSIIHNQGCHKTIKVVGWSETFLFMFQCSLIYS
jgi:hypothetical protein